MAFGQQSGPPASTKQVAEIESLLERAGFSSLREARHIYGLTQRQAGGKFTTGEANELIARLLAGEGELDSDQAAAAVDAIVVAEQRAAKRGAAKQDELLAAVPDDALADELVRRGWVCMPPA
jgi:polyhydroxyalkanoate synthesis regulator phasin